MGRRRQQEEPENHERWLVSYADFITLLFAFFVVMYSISQVSESKYRVLSETLTTAFSKSVPAMTLNPLNIGKPALQSKPSVIESGGEFDSDHIMPGDGAFDKTADLPQLSDMFQDRFADLIDDELVQVHSNELWLEVDLNSNVLFDSAEARPTRDARNIFARVAEILAQFNNPVQVEGFTDNIPINTARYPSNWELSAARAAAAVKLLMDGGVKPERLSAVGYGEHQPIADNSTPEGRAANRRVVLMIAREKMDRPKLRSSDAIARAVEPLPVETSEPYPQPGLAVPSSEIAEGNLMDIFGIKPESGANARTEDTTEQQKATVDRLAPIGEIKPVELKEGGLLFSSDPELERKN